MSWLAREILIVYYPMFRYIAFEYWNPTSFRKVLPILGNGYGFITNFWLSLRYSVMNLAFPYFLGIINAGVSH